MKKGQIYLVKRVSDKGELYSKLVEVQEVDDSIEDPRATAKTYKTKTHSEKSTENTTKLELVKSWLELYGKLLAETPEGLEELQKEYC